MADYLLFEALGETIVVRRADGMSIPNDPMNRHRIEYEQWVALGNEADPATPAEPAPAPVNVMDELQALKARVTILESRPAATGK